MYVRAAASHQAVLLTLMLTLLSAKHKILQIWRADPPVSVMHRAGGSSMVRILNSPLCQQRHSSRRDVPSRSEVALSLP